MNKPLFFLRMIPLCIIISLASHSAQAQKIIDTWSFDTGVDTTLWYDIDGVDSTILAGPKTTGRSGLVEIGFPFTLGPTTHTKFSVNVNGTVHFGNGLVSTYNYFNEPLSNNYNNNGNCPKVEPFGWRGRFDNDSYTSCALIGNSGSRVMVIETRMTGNYWTTGSYCTFQVQLFETGGLRIVFGDAVDDASTGAAQMQNGIATSNSSDKDVIFIDYSTNEAVRWDWTTYDGRNNSTWPEKGRWYMVQPDSNNCPYPPNVVIQNYSPTNLTLSTSGNQADIRLQVPAVGVDTIWPAGQSTFVVTTPFNPSTEYTATLQSVCDSGRTSYRTRDIDFSTDCGEVIYLPWTTDFNDGWECWDRWPNTGESRPWSPTGQGVNLSHAMQCGTTTTESYDEWLKAPVFNLPDTNGLTLKWDYVAQELDSVAPTVDVRVAPCAADGSVDSADWTTVLTLDFVSTSVIQRYVNLDAWRGQRVRVAFVRTGTGGKYAAVTNFMLYLQHEPIMELDVPANAHVGENTLFAAHLLAGVDSLVEWTWHSTLLDSTWSGVWSAESGTCLSNVVYPAMGFDTVTVMLTTAYGAATATVVVDVVNCNDIAAFPWNEDFAHSIDCWETDGWENYHGTGIAAKDETDHTQLYNQIAYCNTVGKYMITPPIVLPVTGIENLALWIECDPTLEVRLNPDASTDPADFTDTLISVPDNGSNQTMLWYTADLEPYTGQTVRVGIFKTSGNTAYVNTIKIDYDTLPKLKKLTVPAKSVTDSTIVCTASLRRGSTDGLTFTWRSSLMDSTVAIPSSDYSSTWSLQYDRGGIDTITVIAANNYGADTLVQTVRVKDCYPATLPWKEDFQDGDVCWYKDATCKWYDAIPYNSSYYESKRHLYLNAHTDTAGSWIMSKQIQLPADSNLHPRLFWKVASSNSSYHHLYSVMVSTAADRTDYSEYYVVYVDSSTHINFSNYDQLSVDLTPYAGQNIHVAFVNAEWHMAPSSIGLYIDDVEIRSTALPRVSMAADGSDYYYGDTATFVATLTEGTVSGLTYTWHSTLLDSTIVAGDTLRLCYGMVDGTDTVTVIAANAYGSAMAMDLVNSVILTQPYIIDFTAKDKAFFMDGDRAETGDTIIYVITRNRCVTTGLTYSLHSTLLDTTVTVATTADTCRITLAYPEEGYDTITALISNIYDTADTATLWLTVEECPAFGVPFYENFDNLGEAHEYVPCWPGYYRLEPNGDSNLAARYGGVGTHYSLITPAIDLPADTFGLMVWWYTSFSGGQNVPIKVFVSPTGSKRISDFTDTLLVGSVPFYDSLSLDAYRGQRIRIAFTMSGYYNIFDDIRIDYDRSAPHVNLYIPSVYTHDSTLIHAGISSGSPVGLVYTWHSTLLDSTWTVNATDYVDWQCGQYLVYGTAGTDTLTVIATTDFGSDTVTRIFDVVDHPLPLVTQFQYPAIVGVNEPVTYSVSLNNCSQNGLNVTLHSSLLDSTIAMVGISHSNDYTLNVIYPHDGIDTVIVTASNVDGVDADTAVVSVVDCGPRAVPYFEDFELVPPTSATNAGDLPGCWTYGWNGSNAAYSPHVIYPTGYTYINNLPDNALLMVAGSSTGYGNRAEAVLPRFADNLQTLSIAFDYRFETANNGTFTVGYRDSVGIFTAVKTIPGHYGSYLRDTVSFVDATIPDGLIVLRYEYTNSWFGMVVDNLEVFSTANALLMPMVALEGPAEAEIYDTVVFTAHLTRGDTAGLAYTWHSTMADQGHAVLIASDSVLRVVYSAVGTDNLTVTVTNAYGYRNASTAVTLGNCSHRSIPYTEDFESVAPRMGNTAGHLPECWRTPWGGAAYATPYVVADEYEWNSTKKIILMAGNTSYYDTAAIVVLPGFEYPIGQLSLALDYNMDVYYGTLSVGYMADSVYTPVYTLPSTGYTMRHEVIDFGGVTNPRARIAIRYLCTTGYDEVFVDNITVYLTDQTGLPPSVSINAPTAAEAFDTVDFTAHLTGGDTTGVLYTWHSSLLGSTWSGEGVWNIVYPTVGIDTVSVVATTAFGADTAVRIVTVTWPDYVLPQITLTSDGQFYTCDPAIYTAHLNRGDTTSLVYTWHSTLLDSTWTMAGGQQSLLSLNYNAGGTDTVTVVAANAYGSDSAVKVVEVTDCQVATTFPYVSAPAASDEELLCWKIWQFDSIQADVSSTHGRWCRFPDYHNNLRPSMMSNEMNNNADHSPLTMDDWLVSPLMALPTGGADTVNAHISLRWNGYCEFTTFQVLLSTTGRTSPANFTDTIFAETQGSNYVNPWTTYTVDLSAYAGQTVSIAFHHSGPIAYYDRGIVRMDSIIVSCTYDTTNTVWHTVSVTSTPEGVCHTYGSGRYVYGDTVEIGYTMVDTAAEGRHWRFLGWSDNVTDNPRHIVVTSDIAITARFAWTADTTQAITQSSIHAFALYPNPASGKVTLQCSEAGNVTIVDMHGRLCGRWTIVGNQQPLVIDTGTLPHGTCFVQLTTQYGTVTKKLIVK